MTPAAGRSRKRARGEPSVCRVLAFGERNHCESHGIRFLPFATRKVAGLFAQRRPARLASAVLSPFAGRAFFIEEVFFVASSRRASTFFVVKESRQRKTPGIGFALSGTVRSGRPPQVKTRHSRGCFRLHLNLAWCVSVRMVNRDSSSHASRSHLSGIPARARGPEPGKTKRPRNPKSRKQILYLSTRNSSCIRAFG